MGRAGIEAPCITAPSTRRGDDLGENQRRDCAGECDRTVDLAVVGQRVDVVLSRDALGVTEQLRNFGQRACALVVQRPSTATQTVRREVRHAARLGRLRNPCPQGRVGQDGEESSIQGRVPHVARCDEAVLVDAPGRTTCSDDPVRADARPDADDGQAGVEREDARGRQRASLDRSGAARVEGPDRCRRRACRDVLLGSRSGESPSRRSAGWFWRRTQ